MKVYLDYIFFENLLINYIVLYQVNLFTKSENKKVYLIVSSVIISIYTTNLNIIDSNFICNVIVKFLVVNVATYIAYFPKKLVEYLKKQLYYYLIYFMYVGIIISVTLFFNVTIDKLIVKIIIYLLSGIILYVFNTFLWKMWKTNIKKDSLTYNIVISSIEIPCFVDTGCSVYDYVNNLDVIFLDRKWYDILLKEGILNKKTNIVIRTVVAEDFITGYIVDNVKVFKKKDNICTLKKIVISFPNQTIYTLDKCTGLIGYNLYMEKLRGVIL